MSILIKFEFFQKKIINHSNVDSIHRSSTAANIFDSAFFWSLREFGKCWHFMDTKATNSNSFVEFWLLLCSANKAIVDIQQVHKFLSMPLTYCHRYAICWTFPTKHSTISRGCSLSSSILHNFWFSFFLQQNFFSVRKFNENSASIKLSFRFQAVMDESSSCEFFNP